jgi:hypothetical protein
MVFICFQERSGAFGPWICQEVKTLPHKFGNVFVTMTNLGKLQKETSKHFGQYNLHVKKDKFMLIRDSWGGQTNLALYDKRFLDENDEPTCSMKMLPKYAPLQQPSDVYIYRQVKKYALPCGGRELRIAPT